MIGITETWLGPGVMDSKLHGYEVVGSRLDRVTASIRVRHHGGIILYRRVSGMLISYLADSKVAERSGSLCTVVLAHIWLAYGTDLLAPTEI